MFVILNVLDVFASDNEAICWPTQFRLSHVKPGGMPDACLQGYTAVAVGIQGVTLSPAQLPENPDLQGSEGSYPLACELPEIYRKAKWLLGPFGQVRDE